MILYLYAPLLYRRFSCAPVLFLMQNLPFSTPFCILHFCILHSTGYDLRACTTVL